ncbi:MAG: hypothetical protein KC649_08350, partial [Candidatus Omnitrophica bacterium]|nr:hypothetical protein [Candidatus Omnitrophota bacterium]
DPTAPSAIGTPFPSGKMTGSASASIRHAVSIFQAILIHLNKDSTSSLSRFINCARRHCLKRQKPRR